MTLAVPRVGGRETERVRSFRRSRGGYGGAGGINGDGGNDAAAYSGAAYVFVRSGTNWSQQAYLKA